MVGSVASSSARGSHSVDRFYNPPQRRQQQQQQVQEQQKQRQKPLRPKVTRTPPLATTAEVREVDSRVESDGSSSKPSVSSSPCASPPPPRLPTPTTNLDRFLQCTTPTVRAQTFYKRGATGRRRLDASNSCLHYSLGDLWESFRECSAYGAGVPLVLNGSDSVTQYYVPYLSGIQLYVDSSCLTSRPLGGQSDGEMYRSSISEGSCGSTADRRFDCISEVSGSQRISDRLSRMSFSDKARAGHEGSSSDDGEIQSIPCLTFEYFESCPPHLREPLADKVSVLASQFPELKTYKSSDLLPSSWISVAWYPIYRIPTGPTLRDLDASFLTFHPLAKPSKSIPNGCPNPGFCCIRKGSGSMDMQTKLSLPVFGLASYKFRSSIWTPDGLSDHDPSSLQQAAVEWLQHLQVEHPDFNFFTGKQRSVYQR